jgi:hypothetical protein
MMAKKAAVLPTVMRPIMAQMIPTRPRERIGMRSVGWTYSISVIMTLQTGAVVVQR